jgi:hypothetical protein
MSWVAGESNSKLKESMSITQDMFKRPKRMFTTIHEVGETKRTKGGSNPTTYSFTWPLN